MRAPLHVALAAALSLSAAAGARADEVADAAARLGAARGFRARIEARDLVAGRTFTAVIVYRAPDRALALIPPDDYVAVDGGRLSVLEGGALRTSDAGAWLRDLGRAIAPRAERAAEIARAAGAAPVPAATDLAAAAGRLGVALEVDFRRREDRVAVALLLSHSLDPRGAAAPGFSFRAPEVAETTYLPSGFPEHVRLRGATGRVDGEVRTVSFEALSEVPDALLAPPAPATATAAAAEEADPSPRFKESAVREALRAVLAPLRAAAARDAGLLEREAAAVRGLILDAYVDLFRAGFAEARLRAEARRAVSAEAPVVLAAMSSAGDARRKEAREGLRARFRESCRRQLRGAVGDLVRIIESVLAPSADAPAADDAARRRLLSWSSGAALEAFERAVVSPMEDEALREIDRLAASGGRADEREPGSAASETRSGGGVAAAGPPPAATSPSGDKRR